jgi:integrase
VGKLQGEDYRAKSPTILKCLMVVNAIFTTALHDQVISFHPGKGVKAPPVAKKVRRMITAVQFASIHDALPDERMQLLIETDIESGLRWGELTELRVKDLDFAAGTVTISRVVVELKAKNRPDGGRFRVKDYPKDREWRCISLAPHLLAKLQAFIARHRLGRNDLIFSMPEPEGPARRRRPEVLPDPQSLGRTPPNEKGRTYHHGTLSAYQLGKCRCDHCRDAVAAYRAERRAVGQDSPRQVRRVDTDGHIANSWFRTRIWLPALEKAELGFHVTPHGLRHAHASWLLAGGADLQVVKERLGHGSIATTEKYLHTLPGADSAALVALDAIRGVRNVTTQGPSFPSSESGVALLQ